MAKQLKSITSADLALFQHFEYPASQLGEWPAARDVYGLDSIRRITGWRTDCIECHNQVFQWLTQWVSLGYAVFVARGYTKGEAVLFGLTQEMPGLQMTQADVPALTGGQEDAWMYA